MSAKNHKIFELNHLLETTNYISKAKDFEGISEIIFDFIEDLIEYDMAVIYNIDWGNSNLEVVSCRGTDINRLKTRLNLKIEESAVGWVAKEKKVLLIDDVSKSKQIKVRQVYKEDPVIRSFLSVPLIVGDRLVGILSVSCSKPKQFKIQDIQMITIIASQGAALLELSNEVRQKERFSNYILDNINSGVMVINKEYEIIIFNKEAEKITGYNASEVVMEKIFDTPLKSLLSEWHLLDCLNNQKLYYEEKSILVNKLGEKLNIRYSTSIIEDEIGETDMCICIFRDDTENEKLQKQLIKAEKLATMGKITSGITHEIRNPLLPIMTASEFLISRENNSLDEQTTKLINIIYNESKRLNRFLEQFAIMDTKNLETGGKALIIESFEEVIVLLEHSLKKEGIVLERSYPEKDIYVTISKDNLKQIFLNIMLNAIDAIKGKDSSENKSKKITIRISNDYNKSLIEIEDTGVGIDPENIDNIFEPFYSTKDKGTGLGLPIVNNLVVANGGEISIKSQPNVGTKFLITMPIVK